MSHDYFGYIASAYGVSAIVLAALCLYTWLDARAARRSLSRMESRSASARKGRA